VERTPNFSHKSQARQYSFERKIARNNADFAKLTESYSTVVEETPASEPQELAAGRHIFLQQTGPCVEYKRSVDIPVDTNADATEHTQWSLDIPWFGWIFRPLISRHIKHRHHKSRQPWWAPPQTFTAHETLVLALLAAASMVAAFINTLFTQTVAFAADEFDVTTTEQGVAAAIVRLGIVLAIPLAILGDRIGRQRIVIALAFIAPVLASLGALAPNFVVLVGTQTIARPVGLALDVAVLVILIEVMPKHGRAYGLSVLALASGFGAGFAVAALPIADLGPSAWRLVYVMALIWIVVALSLRRRLVETPRFIAHRAEPRVSRRETSRKAAHTAPRTLLMVGAVAFLVNIFVATASIFQNRYLKDVRDYSATMVALFTLSTSTPAALGLIIGGKIADINGRRRVAALCIPLGAALIGLSFVLSSVGMWVSAIAGGIVGAIAYPALAVYRGELFPTGNRATSSFLITVAALLGGSIGLVAGGMLVDSGWSYGTVMLSFAAISLVVSVLILVYYPETANKDLEELNPQDAHARFER
jgi:MFS family permease